MDTIVAPITPMIKSAVILLRISGKNALDILTLIKKVNNRSLSVVEPNRCYYCNFFSINNFLIDNIILTYFKAPDSFTGEDIVELSFHGNPLIVTKALNELYKLGFRAAYNGEFSKRAFLNGKIDLTQAEAIQELIDSKSDYGIKYALDRLNGRAKSEFSKLKDSLLNIKAIVEAKLDFPDEDTTDNTELIIKDNIDGLLLSSNILLSSFEGSRRSCKGSLIVFAGKPNVGKSSLLNALLNDERAIVSDTPGTTRDYIQEELYLTNIPITIVDTAGLRDSKSDEIENIGIKRSEKRIESADLVLVILDMSSKMTDEDFNVLDFTKKCNRVIIGNKSDNISKAFDYNVDISISAKDNINIENLITLILEKIPLDNYDIYSNTTVITERQHYLLSEVIKLLEKVNANILVSPLDMTAIDLDIAVGYLEDITGERYSENILDIIFSKFCIGK